MDNIGKETYYRTRSMPVIDGPVQWAALGKWSTEATLLGNGFGSTAYRLEDVGSPLAFPEPLVESGGLNSS